MVADPQTDNTRRRHLTKVILAIILLLGLGLRSCHLANHLDGPMASVPEFMTSSDMHAFIVWAQKIADGDWLCRDTYHPYMNWMEDIGPLAQFETWWGGKEVYHQNPLYAYLLAVSFVLTGDELPLLILQVLFATLALYLIFDIGRRLLDARAGLIAAGLAAIFAPSIVFDAILLRASLNSSLTVLSIWLLFRILDRQSPGRGFAAGLCLAASFFLRPTGLALVFAGPLLLLLMAEPRRQWRRWLPAACIGVLVFSAPFVARNLVVGAPALTFSTRGPETVLQSQTRNADPGFMTLPPAADFRRYMDAGSRSLGSAVATSIESWPEDGPFGWWLRHEWQKLICVFSDHEFQNNVNFWYYRRATPGLDFLPTFGWIVGLGLVGIVLLGLCGRARLAALIPLAAIAALVLGSILGFALGRYRLPIGVLLTIPAGVTLSYLAAWWRAGAPPRNIWIGIAATVAASAVCGLSFTVMPQPSRFDEKGHVHATSAGQRAVYQESTNLRSQEWLMAAQILHQRGETDAAVRLLEEYFVAFGGFYNRTYEELKSWQDGGEASLALLNLLQSFRTNAHGIASVLHGIGRKEKARAVLQQVQQMDAELRRLRGG